MKDHYRTIATPAESRLKIERSDFLGIAVHVESDEDFFTELERVAKRHFDATHHCWAFRLFANGATRARSADAGEPSGTAGKPILNAIEAADLFDLGVIVVRWFGGVKLGTGGLARAYRDTATETLRAASVEDRYLYTRFRLTVSFDSLGIVYGLVSPPAVILAGEHFGETNEFDFDVRASRADEFAHGLTERRIAFEIRRD